MSRHVSLRELLVGVEGLAVLRHLYDGNDESAARRLQELAVSVSRFGLELADTVICEHLVNSGLRVLNHR